GFTHYKYYRATFLLSIFRISSLFYKNQQARMLYSMGFLRKVVFLNLKIILCLQVPNGPFFGIIFYNENDW
ncbi:TPA: hypothetical protein ACL4PU_001899, partial [Streptococcus pneumoniae]